MDRHRTDFAEDSLNVSGHGKSLFDVVITAVGTVDNTADDSDDDDDFCQ